MSVVIGDLLWADSLDQPVTVYDPATGTYREFDLIVQRSDRLVLMRSQDVYDDSAYREWARQQLGGPPA